MAYIANAFLGLTGQEISSFELPWEGQAPACDEVCLEGPAVDTEEVRFLKQSRGRAPGDVEGIEVLDGNLIITVVPSTNKAAWTLVVERQKVYADGIYGKNPYRRR